MSFIDFKEVNIGNPGPPNKYGANQLLELMQILNGKTVSLRKPKIINPWLWLSHQDIKAITTPAINPAVGEIRLFSDSSDSEKLKYKKSDGTVVDLTTATNLIDTLDELTDVIISNPQDKDFIMFNGTSWVNGPHQFINTLTVTKEAEASTAELLLDLKVDDDATSFFRIFNLSNIDGRFSPFITSFASAAVNTERGLFIAASVPDTQDSGSTAVFQLKSNLSPPAAIVNRPVFAVSNNITDVFRIFPTFFDFHDLLLRHVLGIRKKKVSASPTTPPSGYAELYFDTDNVLKIKKDTGVVIDLEAGAGGGATTLDGLTDVTVTTPTNRNALLYNSTATQWENRAIVAADLPTNILTNDVDNNLGSHYVNIAEDTDPPQPSVDNARLFMRSSTGNLSIKKSDNSIVDLEAVGSQSPFVWTHGQSSSANWSNGRSHPNIEGRWNGDDARTHIITENNVIITRVKVGIRSNTKNGSTVVSLVDDGITVPNTTVTIPAFQEGEFATGVISQSITSGSEISLKTDTSNSNSGSWTYVIDTFGVYLLT